MKTGCKAMLAASLCAMLAVAAQAVDVVSYNFDNNSTVGGEGAGSYPGAAAIAGYTNGVVNAGYWYNSWPANPNTNLTNNQGVATTIDIGWSSGSGTYSITGSHPGQDANGTWNKEMLNGYLNGTGTNSTSVTFSQIPYTGYDIYVYFGSDDAARSGTVSDGTTTYSFNVLNGMVADVNAAFIQTTDTGTSFPEANYAVFSNLTGAAKTISTSFMTAGQYGGIAAIQIVENTNALFGVSASPEGSFASSSAQLEATVTDGIAVFSKSVLYLDNVAVATNSTSTGTVNTVSYLATGLTSGEHTCRVDIVSSASSPAVAQSYSWSFEALPFGAVTTSPAQATADPNPALEVMVIEGASILDTTSTTMMLDGSAVAPLVFDRSMAPTAMISYAASGLSIGAHTGKVVIVGSPNGIQTNEWTFVVSPAPTGTAQVVSWNWDARGTVGSPDGMTYSAAPAGVYLAANWNNSWWSFNTSNLMDNAGDATTLDIAWSSYVDYSIQSSHPGVDSDGTFNKEMLNGYLNSGDGNTPTNSSITLSQIPFPTYDIYVYFSSDVTGRQGSVTDGTSTYYFNTIGAPSISSADAVYAQAVNPTTAGYAEAANYAVFSGLSGADQTVAVYIPEYGGIAGIQIVNTSSGPTVDPVIQSIVVSGANVSLSWTAENVGTYSILRKTGLTSGSWTPVLSGLPSGNLTTNVATSGADQEFYRIKGE